MEEQEEKIRKIEEKLRDAKVCEKDLEKELVRRRLVQSMMEEHKGLHSYIRILQLLHPCWGKQRHIEPNMERYD